MNLVNLFLIASVLLLPCSSDAQEKAKAPYTTSIMLYFLTHGANDGVVDGWSTKWKRTAYIHEAGKDDNTTQYQVVADRPEEESLYYTVEEKFSSDSLPFVERTISVRVSKKQLYLRN
jgi:hypothetical protein